MHVCHVLDSLAQGGLENQVLRIIEATHNDRVSYTVCHFGGDQQLQPAFQQSGATLVNLNGDRGFGPKFINPRSILRLAQTAKSEAIDLLHCHTSLIRHPITRVCGRVTRTPVIGTYHNRSDAFHPAARIAERVTRPLSMVNIAVSKGVERSYAGSATEYISGESPLERRTYTIYNGIDVERFSDNVEAARARETKDDTIVFLNIGRYADVKGQETLIRAMPEVIANLPEAELLLVGWGQMEDHLKSLVRDLGLGDNVSITGRVDSVYPFYANADAFVLPSRTEGLSVVLLEAMSANLPIVATDIPGTREAVVDGTTGILVPVGSQAELAAAMSRMADPRTRNRMGSRGYERVSRKFNIDTTVRSYLDVYRRAIEFPGP